MRPSLRPTGALATLALGFVASALLRTGEVVAALPGGGDGFGNPLPRMAQEDAPIGASALAPQAPAAALDEPLAILAELQAKRTALDNREAAMTAREQTMEAMETRLSERLRQLEEAQRRLEQTAVLVDDAAGRDVRHLADMYQQMKPKQAAEIFNRMPPSFAAGFLGEMGSETAALIMANMEPDRAYAVSLLLAGRNVGRGEDRP